MGERIGISYTSVLCHQAITLLGKELMPVSTLAHNRPFCTQELDTNVIIVMRG